MNAASNFAAAALALTDALLFRWLLLLAAICVVIAGVLIGWRRLMRWSDEAIEAAVEAALVCEDPPWIFSDDCFIDNRDDADGWDWLYDQAASLPADAIWFGAEVLADLDELEDWSA